MNGHGIDDLVKFDPVSDPIIYHYCTTDTFLSIIDSKTIWTSDINTMNDFGEVHWGYDRFIEAANRVIDTVGKDFLDEIDSRLSETQLNILPAIASFSTEGDMLSQWRAYAADGHGVSIGFDSAEMAKLSMRHAMINYSQEQQTGHFTSMILALHEVYNKLPDREKDSFMFEMIGKMGCDLALFKSPAFSEEKEVRFIRALNVTKLNGEWGLKDEGGQGEKQSRKKLKVKYRSSENGGIISYVALPISGLGEELIKEVIVGPKNACGGPEISMALKASGFTGTKIIKSTATYR